MRREGWKEKGSQTHKRYSLSHPLPREGMIIVNNSGLTGDPTNTKVEIDRRMLDFCVGLDTEFSEIVEGSHLYFPQTKFEQVYSTSDIVLVSWFCT